MTVMWRQIRINPSYFKEPAQFVVILGLEIETALGRFGKGDADMTLDRCLYIDSAHPDLGRGCEIPLVNCNHACFFRTKPHGADGFLVDLERRLVAE